MVAERLTSAAMTVADRMALRPGSRCCATEPGGQSGRTVRRGTKPHPVAPLRPGVKLGEGAFMDAAGLRLDKAEG